MIAVACVLLYLGIAKDYEPLLLVPIGAGCLLANLPLSPLIADDGMLRVLYNAGIANELFPLLIFIGIGALTDFGPLLENPRMVLLGAAGQFGIFLTLILALAARLQPRTRRRRSGSSARSTVRPRSTSAASWRRTCWGPITVAAYSYMSLVPIILPPIMRAADDAARARDPHAVQPARDQPAHPHPLPDRRHGAGRDAGAVRDAADRHADARQPDEGVGRGPAAHEGLVRGDRQHRDALPRARHRLDDGRRASSSSRARSRSWCSAFLRSRSTPPRGCCSASS